jgi:hypothetical protein
MTSIHGKCILMFVPVAVFVVTIMLIMSSGCVTSSNANESVTVTSLQQTPVEVVTQHSSGQSLAGQSLWLHMDSLQNITVPPGERLSYTGPFFINGTTNLPAREPLSLELDSTCTIPCPSRPFPETIGCCGADNYGGYTEVQQSATGVNTWSFLVNTSPDNMTVFEINDKVDDTNGITVSVAHGNHTDEDYVTAQGLFFMKLQGVP